MRATLLEHHSRYLTDRHFTSRMSRSRIQCASERGVPRSSMPAWKSVLSDDEIEAIVAYAARAFSPIAGQAAGSL